MRRARSEGGRDVTIRCPNHQLYHHQQRAPAREARPGAAGVSAATRERNVMLR